MYQFASPLLLLLATSLLLAAEPAPKKPAERKANRLAKESSPYLLQHAHNPVDWYPWGTEAFAKAKKDGKLIFLSIGYSSCHWCHVMERESFENAEIAKVLNEHFICIKVDREERPDIDEVYLNAVQVTGISGGWPLNLFLTAEGKPIFGGTYFPPEDKVIDQDTTITGFKSILKRVQELQTNKKEELIAQANQIARRTAERLDTTASVQVPLSETLLKGVAEDYELDPEYGGLGRALMQFRGTKFPRVAALQFLQRQAHKPGNAALAKLMTNTLTNMAIGGLYDHLGGGFHRYSTERTWSVPHFEKMLYDNAQLVELYAAEYPHTLNPLYKRVIEETLAFVQRELTAPEGYFYSALDADSDGVEGKFYVWTAKELKAILGEGPDVELFQKVYSTTKPNFEEKYSILRMPDSLSKQAEAMKLTEAALLLRLEPLKAKLLAVREKRIRPFRDTKLITGWNGQMIAAYAEAGRVLKKPEYTATAVKAAEFLLMKLTDSQGRLLRIYAAVPGEKPTARGPAFLDDYAYVIHGLLSLHDATGEKKWLDSALKLQSLQQKWFHDDKNNGYFHTAHDGEKLFARGKDAYDGAQPSGNGVSVRNLVRIYDKTHQETDRMNAVKTLKTFAALMKSQPTAVPLMTDSLDRLVTAKVSLELPTKEVALPVAPAEPKSSADVVSVELQGSTPAGEGLVEYQTTLRVAKGWHIYANPVENPQLLASTTVLEILADGQPVKATEVKYPKGKPHKGPDGDYLTYEGEIPIVVKVQQSLLKDAKQVSVKVKLIACNEKVCLLPATLKANAK